MRRLMIVAHPDDEVIFGYLILRTNPGMGVVCVTNGTNPVRSSEFKYVVRSLGCLPEIWDYEDKWGGDFPAELTDRLRRLVKHCDAIHTHGPEGEYGHSQHRDLSKKVVEAAGSIPCYGFGLGEAPLPFDILADKLTLLKQYRSQYQLRVFDWFGHENPSNRMMNYIVSEGHRRIN